MMVVAAHEDAKQRTIYEASVGAEDPRICRIYTVKNSHYFLLLQYIYGRASMTLYLSVNLPRPLVPFVLELNDIR